MNWKPNWPQRLILIIYAVAILLAASAWDYKCTDDARYFDVQPCRPYLAYLIAYISAAIAALISVYPRKKQ
ncbi:MAG: hypothetical protein PHP93_07010 [Kiritimatiellales bacterium]|nr:hypothetical protein [Kiritimatiellales bacterium]